MESWFRAAARFEHFQHAVGDKEAADDVAGGGDDGDGAKHGGQCGLMFSRQENCSDYGDGVESVRERHQRRVQERRHAANYLQADECGQQKHIGAGEEVHFHRQAVSLCAATRGGSEKNSRTRGLTTSPPCVSRVLLMMSSSKLSWNFPSFTSRLRKAAMLRAYIWLA